ncbi:MULTISPECIES: hypothetical protein [Paenibacillus]|nr:hypothetical protein [Paenibacillus caseinilyticus]MCZ8520947.1 hypothetical protein [Paenibacillus caseinilyticus]
MLALLQRIKQWSVLSRTETPDEELQHMVEEAVLDFFKNKQRASGAKS